MTDELVHLTYEGDEILVTQDDSRAAAALVRHFRDDRQWGETAAWEHLAGCGNPVAIAMYLADVLTATEYAGFTLESHLNRLEGREYAERRLRLVPPCSE